MPIVTGYAMATKIITNIILIMALSAAQIAFISALPGLAVNLNLVLVVLIFILGFSGFDLAAIWSLALGFILETYSFLPFGAYLASLILTVVIANFLLNYFFTNRSLYSFLALAGLTTIIYEIIIGSLIFILEKINLAAAPAGAWLGTPLISQIGLNLIATFFIFYFVHFLGRNLKPVFLIHPVK
ncbi:MAG: hypothetical protein Q8O93_01385 [bacterium]|nr:hypothetical protein [bacterium]